MAIQVNGKNVIQLGSATIPVLKGDKGDTGKQGEQGIQGVPGSTPVKGADYWTSEDKQEIVETLKAELNPRFVNLENNKEDKKEGYGLSQNDFTNELKKKLDELSTEEHFVKEGHYDEENSEVVLILTNGNEVRIPVNNLIDDFYIKSEIDTFLKSKQDQIDALKAENEQQAEQINYLDKTLVRAEASGENINIKDSAEYPISKISIDTNIKQDSITDNLFDNEWELGQINTDGEDYTTSTSIRNKNYQKVVSNVLYELSRTITTGYMYFRFYDKDYNFLGSQSTEGFVTTNQEDNRMYVGENSMKLTINNTNIAYMRCVDSITDTTQKYTMTTEQTPSIAYPSEIKTPVGKQSFVSANKNWLPTDKSKWESGHYDVNGIKTNYSTRMRLIDLLPIQSNTTYCASDTNGTETFILRGFNNKKEFVQNIGVIYSYNNNPTFKTNEDVVYLGVSVDITYSDYVEENHQLFIYLNSETEKSFIEHQSQVQDLDVGELLGTIVDKEDGAYFENRYGKIILDGTTNKFASKSGTTVNNVFNTASIPNIKSTSSNNVKSNIKSNYFKVADSWNILTSNSIEGISGRIDTVIGIGFGLNSEIDTVEKANNLLIDKNTEGNPVEIVYPLATPKYTKLTDEQQAQWNKIKKMHTYEGVTNIYTINEEGISPILNLEYVKSPTIIQEENDERLKALESAIISMGGNI